MYIQLVNLANVQILRLAAVSWYPQTRSPRCRFTSCEWSNMPALRFDMPQLWATRAKLSRNVLPFWLLLRVHWHWASENGDKEIIHPLSSIMSATWLEWRSNHRLTCVLCDMPTFAITSAKFFLLQTPDCHSCFIKMAAGIRLGMRPSITCHFHTPSLSLHHISPRTSTAVTMSLCVSTSKCTPLKSTSSWKSMDEALRTADSAATVGRSTVNRGNHERLYSGKVPNLC